jgi:hypothetical protein
MFNYRYAEQENPYTEYAKHIGHFLKKCVGLIDFVFFWITM